jgi:hypothetical protein
MKKTERIIRNDVDKQQVCQFIQYLSENKPWEITIAEHRKKRSNPQNKTIHMWFATMSEESGASEDDVKEEMIQRFCPKAESTLTPGMWRPKRTHELDTVEMVEFMARVYQLACEFNIWLDHPDDQGR